MGDNRRRISENIIEEVESFDGKDFSERLLKWKNGSDKVPDVDYSYIESIIQREIEELKEELRP